MRIEIIIGIIVGIIAIFVAIIKSIKYFWSLHRNMDRINDCIGKMNKLEDRLDSLHQRIDNAFTTSEKNKNV